jgi:WD40 repeat protein
VNRVLALGEDGGIVTSWDVHAERLSQAKPIPQSKAIDRVSTLAFSPDGSVLAAGSSREKRNVVLSDAQTHRPLGPPLRGNLGGATALTFSPDGKLLASGSGGNELVILRAVPTGQRVGPPLTNPFPVADLAFSPDGRMLAGVGGDDRLVIWNMTGKEPTASVLRAEQALTSVAFSPDGKLLASGTDNGRIVLWDLPDHQPVAGPLAGHDGAVHRLVFSPDSRTLASGDDAGSVLLWDMGRRQPLGQVMNYQAPVSGLAFSSDGQLLASSDSSGVLTTWDMRVTSWQERACAVANRNLSRAEWDQFGSGSPYQRTCSQFP